MNFKTTIFFSILLLLISSLSNAQTQNPYLDFAPEELKKNKDYVKNFNAGNYDFTILYNCMMDVINSARYKYRFADPLLHDIRLDSTAQMQADYQAVKDEKTDINYMPHKTVGERLKKYELSSNGTELIFKARAHRGTEEYSYYDLCMEVAMTILKNVKTAEVLLAKQYTYVGFGIESDEYMRSMYGSIVLGNDLVFNDDKPGFGVKDLPYQKGKTGLRTFDSKICQKCIDDFTLERVVDHITVKAGDVILEYPNLKELRKMLGRDGDAIMLDFVPHSSYQCEKVVKDNDFVHRGFLSKPITLEKIMAENEEPDAKSNKLKATIAIVPEVIDLEEPFDVNVIVLKEKNIPCKTLYKKQIEIKNWGSNEKVDFMKDDITVESAGDWVLTEEEGVIEFIIPLPLNKMTFTKEDIETAMMGLDYPKYNVQKVSVIAYHSLDHANDPTQRKNQQKRVEAMTKILAQTLNISPITDINYIDNWDDFKRDMVYSSEYYDLMLGTKEEAIAKLKAGQGKIAKEIEAEYLQNHRYAKIVMNVVYPINGELENEFVLYKFNKAIEEKNIALAMSIQKYIMGKVEQEKYPISIPNRMQIPENADHQSFLTNKLYMQYYLSKTMSDKMAEDANKIFDLKPTNNIAYFNRCVVKVTQAVFTTTADITKLQLEIDKLNTMPQIPKDIAANLNLELQFKIITFIKSQPSSTESDNLLTSTYNKIKSVTPHKMSSWRNAYRLAYYFFKNDDYGYALKLMDPFVSDADVSLDFIFAYISIAATQDASFMSSLFTKAVKRAATEAPTRLCGLFDKLPISIFDNKEVQKTVCKTCNR